MTNILLTIDKKTYQITEVVATMIDESKQNIKFSKYEVNVRLPEETFIFNNKYVPMGTPIIDLR